MVAELEVTPSFPEALTWPERAKSIAIRDQESYDLAANMKMDLAALRKKIVEEFAPMKEAAHKAHKAITTKENEYLAPIEQAEKLLVGTLKAWTAEQERLRIAEQRRMEAEARAREEEDRQRRIAEAAAIRAEDERRAAELRRQDEEARLAAALEAQVVGASEETVAVILETPVIDVPEVAPVEAYMEPAAMVIPQVAAPTYERAKGLGISTRWGARVFSIKDLCRAVADGKAPENFVLPNMPALNARAKSDQTGMNVPGVRAVKE